MGQQKSLSFVAAFAVLRRVVFGAEKAGSIRFLTTLRA